MRIVGCLVMVDTADMELNYRGFDSVKFNPVASSAL
jgi:hypothetical protein